ncbi:TPA: O-antigen ligase family protein [Vibrio cholerae]
MCVAIYSVRFIFVMIVLFLSLTYQSLYYTDGFLYDLSMLLKSLLLPLALLFFVKNKNSIGINAKLIIERVFLITFVMISVNVLLGLLNIGYTTYGSNLISSGNGHGFKGFVFAGNELGALLLVTYPAVVTFFKERGFIQLSLINIIYVLVSILIGTKTAMFGIILLVAYNFYSINDKAKFKIVIVMLFLSFLSYFLYLNLSFIENYYDRFMFFYEKNGYLFLIFSGRYEFLREVILFVDYNYNIFDYIFGIGASYANNNFKSVEIDFFDLFVWHGIIWCIIVYISFVYIMFHVARNDKEKQCLFMFVILLLVSSLAGHVLTSAMITPLLALYFPYFYNDKSISKYKS